MRNEKIKRLIYQFSINIWIKKNLTSRFELEINLSTGKKLERHLQKNQTNPDNNSNPRNPLLKSAPTSIT